MLCIKVLTSILLIIILYIYYILINLFIEMWECIFNYAIIVNTSFVIIVIIYNC